MNDNSVVAIVSETVRIGKLKDRSPGFGMIFQCFPIDEDRERLRSLHERPWVERRSGDRQGIDERSSGSIDALDPFTDLPADRKPAVCLIGIRGHH